MPVAWTVLTTDTSGCGAVGKMVTSETRDPPFEPRHLQKDKSSGHYRVYFCVNCKEMTSKSLQGRERLVLQISITFYCLQLF